MSCCASVRPAYPQIALTPLPLPRTKAKLYGVLVTKKRIEFELDEEQLARLDWLCQHTGKSRQELLQEGVRWVFRTNDGPWDLDDPWERAALDALQARALLEFDRTNPWPQDTD